MADAITNKVFDAFKVLQDGATDMALEARIRDFAAKQTILPASGSLLESDEYVGSPVMKVLADNMDEFKSTLGVAHVLYAPPSTGKSTSLRYFFQFFLKNAGAPALMISSNLNYDDYLGNVAKVLSIREERSDASWIATLVSALLPRPGEQLRHAPVLVFDEFNFRGRDDKNVYFADSFARGIYGKRFTVLFVTQNLDMAKELCQLNGWQKIGPLPLLTVPDRWSLKEDETLPENYTWKTMQWTTKRLSLMILKRKVFGSKFDEEVDEGGCLPWLADVSTPTVALVIAHKRLAKISSSSGGPGDNYEPPSADFFDF